MIRSSFAQYGYHLITLQSSGKHEVQTTAGNYGNLIFFIKLSTSNNAFLAFWFCSLNLGYQLIYLSLTLYEKQNFSWTKRRKKVDFASFLPTKQVVRSFLTNLRNYKLNSSVRRADYVTTTTTTYNKVYLKNFHNGLEVLAGVSFQKPLADFMRV